MVYGMVCWHLWLAVVLVGSTGQRLCFFYNLCFFLLYSSFKKKILLEVFSHLFISVKVDLICLAQARSLTN